jgi:hypothetical protein
LKSETRVYGARLGFVHFLKFQTYIKLLFRIPFLI